MVRILQAFKYTIVGEVKMKTFRSMIIAVFVFSVVLCISETTQASSSISEKKIPVLLQVNDYDVIYTFPKQPYLDKNNRLMIPLRAISELLGAKVSYDSINKEASIGLNGKTLNIKADSNLIEVDNTPKQMDTIPVVYSQSLFVPIRALIDNLDLHTTQNPKTGLVHIQSEALDEFNMMQVIKESDTASSDVQDNNAILPLLYDLKLTNMEKGKLLSGQIKVTARNISGKSIEKGKEDLHLIFLFDNTFQMEADYPTTDQSNERSRPALNENQTFDRVIDFSAGNYDEKLKYILAMGRIFK